MEKEKKIEETEEYRKHYNDKELWFNKFLFKIETIDGLYYTISEDTKDDIVKLWIYLEALNQSTNIITLNDVIEEIKKRGCNYIMNWKIDCQEVGKVDEGLLYLKKENMIINKNQIKKTFYQFIS